MSTTLLALLLVCLVGLPVARILTRDSGVQILLGSTFLLGSAIVCLTMMLLTFSGIPWTRASLLLGAVTIALVATLLLKGHPSYQSDGPVRIEGLNRPIVVTLDAILLIFIASNVAYVTAASPWEWDFIGIWGLKGSEFFASAGIDWDFLQRDANTYTHPDYPPLLPLLYSWIATIGGEWNDRYLGLVGTCFAVSALLVVRGVAMSLTASRILVAVLSLALFRPLFDTPVALADGPLSAFFLAALSLLLLGLREENRVGALPWILVGAATLTKNEGLTFAIATLALVGLFDRRHWLRNLILVGLIASSWQVPRAVYGLSTDLLEGSIVSRAVENAAHLPGALLTTWPGHPFVWLASVFGLLIGWRALARYRLPLAVAGAQLLFYLGAYLASPHDLEWHVGTSWPRLTLHLLPIVVFVGVMAVSSVLQEGPDGHGRDALNGRDGPDGRTGQNRQS